MDIDEWVRHYLATQTQRVQIWNIGLVLRTFITSLLPLECFGRHIMLVVQNLTIESNNHCPKSSNNVRGSSLNCFFFSRPKCFWASFRFFFGKHHYLCFILHFQWLIILLLWLILPLNDVYLATTFYLLSIIITFVWWVAWVMHSCMFTHCHL